MNNEHIPVLLNEVIDGLNIKKDGTYLDLTLGRAGHSSVILSKLDKGLLIGVDQDDEAIEKSRARLKAISENYVLVRDNFVNIDTILKGLKVNKVDGILMDLGVSSLTAKKVVNEYSLNDLVRIFNEYGEEKFSYPIAKRIVKERVEHPINTTFELVDIIKRSKPSKELSKVGHPAKQIFQALRIEVNDEINILKETLVKALNHLNKGGRLAVITFHSGEDKIVKKLFKDLTVIEGNRYDLPENNKQVEYRLITRKGIKPSEEEIQNNHRSISSVLRIIEKV